MVWILQDAAVEPFTHFPMKYQWFWNMQDTAMNPLLMVWDLQEVAVKQFAWNGSVEETERHRNTSQQKLRTKHL